MLNPLKKRFPSLQSLGVSAKKVFKKEICLFKSLNICLNKNL